MARGFESKQVESQQVMLDRAGFSPGVIDGHAGSNTARALAAFQQQGTRAAPTFDPVSRYRITAEDAAGPYVAIPEDMMEKSSCTAHQCPRPSAGPNRMAACA